MENLIVMIIASAIIILFVIVTILQRKEVKKDWETLDYLKEKCKNVKTKEEIEVLHKEFVEKASKIYNRYIHVELKEIDGYLKGMYKALKNENYEN